ELSWLPWLVSRLLGRAARLDNLAFHRGDFLRACLPRDGVLVCYLFRDGMRLLADKLAREGRTPPMIISHTFALPAARADEVLCLDDLHRTRIHVYRGAATAA